MTSSRQPHRFSQGAKILRLLSDGEWHTTREILREVPCIVHSRVSELRRSYGWNIEHETTGAGAAGSRYRLLGEGDGNVHGGAVPSSASPSEPVVTGSPPLSSSDGVVGDAAPFPLLPAPRLFLLSQRPDEAHEPVAEQLSLVSEAVA